METKEYKIPEERYCTVAESLVESFNEVKQIRDGKLQPMSLSELWANCEKWKEEIKDKN